MRDQGIRRGSGRGGHGHPAYIPYRASRRASVGTCQAFSAVPIGPPAGMIATRVYAAVRLAKEVVRAAGSQHGSHRPTWVPIDRILVGSQQLRIPGLGFMIRGRAGCPYGSGGWSCCCHCRCRGWHRRVGPADGRAGTDIPAQQCAGHSARVRHRGSS